MSPLHAIFFRPLIGPQIAAGSTRHQPVCRINQAAASLAGSTRQQTIGRINQVADRGEGDEDEDEGEDKDDDEDEIPSYAVLLLTVSAKRFGVSR